MPDPKTIERLRGLVLSANDLKGLTDWPDALVEDYLNIVDNFILLADIVDIEIDQKLEEIPTDFINGSVPFVESGLLIEDNTNLIWDNLNNILTVLNIITERIKIANDGLQILDTNGTHVLTIKPGSDLTGNRIYTIITGDSNRTITLQGNPTLNDWFDQSVKIAASPTFAGLTLASIPLTLLNTARIKRHIPLGAGRLVKHGNNDPTLNDEGLYTTEDFAAIATQELFYEKNVPYRWDDTTDMVVEIYWMLDANEANDALFVRWGIGYKSTAVGEAVAGVGTSFTEDTNTLSAVAGILMRTVMTTKMLVTNMNYHECLAIRIYRDGPNDDAIGTARLIAVRVEFIMNKLGKTT